METGYHKVGVMGVKTPSMHQSPASTETNVRFLCVIVQKKLVIFGQTQGSSVYWPLTDFNLHCTVYRGQEKYIWCSYKKASVCRDIEKNYYVWCLAKNCTVYMDELLVSIEDNIQSTLLVVLHKWKMQMPAKTLAFLTYNI